jgi:hypothetical protein
MSTYRQGEGEIKTFHGIAPTHREPSAKFPDGEPLPPGDIAGYIMFAQYEDETVVETIDIQLVDGAFSEPLEVDLVSAGTWKYWFRTVGIRGLQSADSEVLTLEVLAPFAPPNPPTGLSVS